jgi:hypothetical protein
MSSSIANYCGSEQTRSKLTEASRGNRTEPRASARRRLPPGWLAGISPTGARDPSGCARPAQAVPSPPRQRRRQARSIGDVRSSPIRASCPCLGQSTGLRRDTTRRQLLLEPTCRPLIWRCTELRRRHCNPGPSEPPITPPRRYAQTLAKEAATPALQPARARKSASPTHDDPTPLASDRTLGAPVRPVVPAHQTTSRSGGANHDDSVVPPRGFALSPARREDLENRRSEPTAAPPTLVRRKP